MGLHKILAMLLLFSGLGEDVIINTLHRFCEEPVRVFFCFALYAECKESVIFVTPTYMTFISGPYKFCGASVFP